MPEGSPLKVHTERQTILLQSYLGEKTTGTPVVVDYAMRYGNPSIPDVLARLKAQNCQRILLVPLYPQYAASATATALDAVFGELQQMRNMPAVRSIKHFHDDTGYIKATAQNIRDYWTLHGRPDKLVMSFHGVPRYTLDKGDPYHCECLKSGRLIAEELGLHKEQYIISFQSRFGKAEWIKPYTTATLKELGQQRTKRVDVVCPALWLTAWKRWKKSRRKEGRIFSTPAAGSIITSPVSTSVPTGFMRLPTWCWTTCMAGCLNLTRYNWNRAVYEHWQQVLKFRPPLKIQTSSRYGVAQKF